MIGGDGPIEDGTAGVIDRQSLPHMQIAERRKAHGDRLGGKKPRKDER
jgi:hypothetical protein